MGSKNNIQQLRECICKGAHRIVVKVGSSVITTPEGLNLGRINALTAQISLLWEQKKEVILVTSGAIAAGMRKMGLKKRPVSLPKQQALAAIGQGDLIHTYEEAFAQYDQKVAQILLTRDGLVQRHRYLNARNTLFSLLHWNVIPIINENDTVTVEEIQFGDNDNLAGLIAAMVEADLLILLTDMKGLYDADPRICPEAKCIGIIESIDEKIERLGQSLPNKVGRGGIGSKIKVAKQMMQLGIPVVIAGGFENDVLLEIVRGKAIGTFFVPQKIKRIKKHWLASLLPKGKLVIDDGAVKAIVFQGGSLLPSGIVKVDGEFLRGDPVVCIDKGGNQIAIGLSNYNSIEVAKIKGLKTGEIEKVLGHKDFDEVIHRDNMCILN